MGLLWEILLSLLCALGLGLLGALLFGRLLRPIPGGDLWLLIPGRGDGARLEQEVRGAMWLRGLGLLNCPVVIVDLGLTGQGRALAFQLLARWNSLVLWPGDHLSELLQTEEHDQQKGGN